ncbi:MAG: iron ABC transporter permease [Bacillota bacterium]|nr:MAG: iron ABC transporter [Bacillota bacterium]
MYALFRSRPGLGLLAGLGLLVLAFGISLASGLQAIPIGTVLEALTAFDGSPAHLVVRSIRLPRTLIAMAVGGCLGVAGTLTQALTRNPLAAPGTLGINAGATLAVAAGLYLLGTPSLHTLAWLAFLGAAAAAGAVYALANLGRGGVTPLRLTLAGAAMAGFLTALTQGVLVASERTLDEIRLWLAGSVAGRDPEVLRGLLPYMLVGLALALGLGRPLNALSLGEEVARGLGQRTGWVKAAGAAAVVLLAGSAVAAAGPIGFLGLAVPHLSRWIVGPDYRWVLPYSGVLGAILLILADVGARLIIRPGEAPVGVVTALLGVPFFIALARREVGRR